MLLGWWTLGRQASDSGALDDADVENRRDESERSREMVRRNELIDADRSVAAAVRAEVDDGGDVAIEISGVVRANGRVLSSATVWCEPMSENLPEALPGATTTSAEDSDIEGAGFDPMGFDRRDSSGYDGLPAGRGSFATSPIYGGIRNDRRKLTFDGTFSFDRLWPGIYIVGAEVIAGDVRHRGHVVVDARAAPSASVAIDLDLCRVEIIAIGGGALVNDAVWRILDEAGRVVDRREETRSAEQDVRPPAPRPFYVRTGRNYKVEACAEGHHPLEFGFAIKEGQREATIEAVMRRLDPNGALRLRFDGPREGRPELVRFRIGPISNRTFGADGPQWTEERSDIVSGFLPVDEEGTAILSGLALRTKRHLLTIEIPDFPLTDRLEPETVPFDFSEGTTCELNVRLERGGHLKAIVRFPIDPGDDATINIEATDGRDLLRPVPCIWSFDSFGGRRLIDLALRHPTGERSAPVDRPLRTARPLAPGRYILSITAPGLETGRAAFEIKAAATSEIEITMRHE